LQKQNDEPLNAKRKKKEKEKREIYLDVFLIGDVRMNILVIRKK